MNEALGAGTPRSGHGHITVIEPPGRWQLLPLAELWAYRELLWVLTTRDVKVRYKQTALGAGWALLRPLLTMLIFTLVFGRWVKVPSDGIPYSLFVLCGLLPWLFFASALTSSSQSLIGSSQLVTKIYFPRLLIPVSAVGAALVDMGVTCILLVGVMWAHSVALPLSAVLAPFFVLLALVSAIGFGCLFAALTVTYRDVTHLIPFLTKVWMYATPVVFPISVIPEPWRGLAYLNPMTGAVEGFKASMLGRPFDGQGIAISVAVAVVAAVAGIACFQRTERRFADVI